MKISALTTSLILFNIFINIYNIGICENFNKKSSFLAPESVPTSSASSTLSETPLMKWVETQTADSKGSLLCVCSANHNRSVAMELLLARYLGELGLSEVKVRSAGTFLWMEKDQRSLHRVLQDSYDNFRTGQKNPLRNRLILAAALDQFSPLGGDRSRLFWEKIEFE